MIKPILRSLIALADDGNWRGALRKSGALYSNRAKRFTTPAGSRQWRV